MIAVPLGAPINFSQLSGSPAYFSANPKPRTPARSLSPGIAVIAASAPTAHGGI